MAESVTPEVAAWRLRSRLRGLRRDAGLVQADVARALEWSTRKVIRIEKGDVHASVADVRAMLALYSVSASQADKLVEMTRWARSTAAARNVHPTEARTFFGLEATAHSVRTYAFDVVPSQLQIPGYGRAVDAALQTVNEDDLRSLQDWTEWRQQRLEREDGGLMEVLLDESVVHRRVAGEAVQRDQVRRLAEISRDVAVVAIQIVPFSADTHSGLVGSFSHLESMDPEMDDVVCVTSPPGTYRLSWDVETTVQYRERFADLQSRAMSEKATRELLHDLGR